MLRVKNPRMIQQSSQDRLQKKGSPILTPTKEKQLQLRASKVQMNIRRHRHQKILNLKEVKAHQRRKRQRHQRTRIPEILLA